MLSFRSLSQKLSAHAARAISFSEKGVYFRMEKNGSVAEVIMNRPKQLNTMNDGYFAELGECMQVVDDSADIHAVLLWAEGKHFSAGLDLKEASEMFLQDASALQKAKFAASVVAGKALNTPISSPSERGMPAMRNVKLYRMIRRWQESITALETCRVPVIAAVHGKCIGGAVDLITAADIRLCTKDVDISIKETEVAIVADMGTLQRITRIVNRGFAREMTFTGQSVFSGRALETNLVNHVYESKDEMVEAGRKMAALIASHSPLTVQGAKRVLNYSEDHTIEDGLNHVALWNSAFLKSDDLIQAASAFITKQRPSYTDYLIPESEAGSKK